VRLQAVVALGRLGTAQSVPHLIAALDDASWELRQNAWLALCRMTAQEFPSSAKTDWVRWWDSSRVAEKEGELLSALQGQSNENNPARTRREILRALRCFATAASEEPLLALLRSAPQPPQPPLQPEERTLIAETLERIGTEKSVPLLAGQRSDAAAWALGRIGGVDAEKALLEFPKTLAVLLALDRLHSTNAAPFLPHLIQNFGLVTFRSQPDDLMNDEAQPIQRVAANLIRRTGQAPLLIELTLQELEDSMQPPIVHGPRPNAPEAWTKVFVAMRDELKPGFVRGDGLTTSQPLTALSHLADDPNLVARLLPLLKHPAFVPRIYVAMTLGRLRAAEAAPAMVSIIREGYPFSDATSLASGKHFEHSQTVRWRGFLCMALGRIGGDEARRALEILAADQQQSRDVRYSSVVGLRFIGSPKSLSVLERIARSDTIWMVRDEAEQTMKTIPILQQEARQ
jgi:HEAT repeat protein